MVKSKIKAKNSKITMKKPLLYKVKGSFGGFKGGSKNKPNLAYH
jgi:hypothetical protein